MTAKERKDFNQMKAALTRITTYQSADSLRKRCKKDWGLTYEEALEMSYENVLDEAITELKGVRKLKEEENG